MSLSIGSHCADDESNHDHEHGDILANTSHHCRLLQIDFCVVACTKFFYTLAIHICRLLSTSTASWRCLRAEPALGMGKRSPCAGTRADVLSYVVICTFGHVS